MQTYPHQNLEQAFTRAIVTGEDQEGTASRGGFQVGIAPEREMANYIEDLGVDGNADPHRQRPHLRRDQR